MHADVAVPRSIGDKAIDTEAYRVVVRSIGTANPRLRSALSGVLSRPPVEVLRSLLQAPSVLVEGVTREAAEGIAGLLASVGLSAGAEPLSIPFEPGRGDHEVALVVKDVSRLPEIIALVAEVMELDAEGAAKIVWDSPAVLLGQISRATVDALAERFAALGAELDVSRPREAIYDVLLGACDEPVRRLVDRAVRESGIAAPFADAGSGPLIAAGLGHDEASALWERVCRTGAPVRVVSRDFQRFDVRLEEATASPELFDYLVRSVGMPRAVAERVPQKTPLVLHAGASHARAHEALAELAALGARATAHLVTFQTFTLQVERVGDVAATARLLERGAGLPPGECLRLLTQLPCTVARPLKRLRAMWLAHELKQVGTRARLLVP